MTLWDFIKGCLFCFVCAIGIFLFTWAAGCNSLALEWFGRGNQLMLDKTFAPKEEAVKREVFEQTPSFINGKVQELRTMQFQYLRATPDNKIVLRGPILREAEGISQDLLPVDLRDFISTLRRSDFK